MSCPTGSKNELRCVHSRLSYPIDEIRFPGTHIPYIQHCVIIVCFWILEHHFLLYLLAFYIFHAVLCGSNYDQIEGAANDRQILEDGSSQHVIPNFASNLDLRSILEQGLRLKLEHCLSTKQ